MDGIVRLEELLALRPSPIFFECVSGSRAYGTATATSDEDIRGIFAVPAASYLDLVTPPNASRLSCLPDGRLKFAPSWTVTPQPQLNIPRPRIPTQKR